MRVEDVKLNALVRVKKEEDAKGEHYTEYQRRVIGEIGKIIEAPFNKAPLIEFNNGIKMFVNVGKLELVSEKQIKELKVITKNNGIKPTKFIEQDLATIVFFNDDTKVVVKQSEFDEYDREKAFAIALAKKMMGGYTNFVEFFELDDEDEEDVTIELQNPLFQINDQVELIIDTEHRGKKGEVGVVVSHQNQDEEIGRKFPYVVRFNSGKHAGFSTDEIRLVDNNKWKIGDYVRFSDTFGFDLDGTVAEVIKINGGYITLKSADDNSSEIVVLISDKGLLPVDSLQDGDWVETNKLSSQKVSGFLKDGFLTHYNEVLGILNKTMINRQLFMNKRYW